MEANELPPQPLVTPVLPLPGHNELDGRVSPSSVSAPVSAGTTPPAVVAPPQHASSASTEAPGLVNIPQNSQTQAYQSPVVSQVQPPLQSQTQPSTAAPVHHFQSLPAQSQFKRTSEDTLSSNAKRYKSEAPTTPGLMGPPSAMGPPVSQVPKKKDDGLDEGDPNDVFGGAGINLQDEERNMTAFEVPRNAASIQQPLQSTQQAANGDRARKSEFLHYGAMEYMINKKLSESGLHKYDNEIHSLMSLAVKDRLSGLLGQMIVLAKHRCAPPPANRQPIDDVGRILKGISLIEAQDEERRRTIAAARRLEEETKRREAEDASSASKKKPGQAKTLTEQAIARNANATAQMMLNQSGGKKYSWMTGSPNTSQLPRRNTVQAANGIQPNVFKSGSEEHGNLITLKDFIGAIELEGEDVIGRGGRALLKAYTQLKD